jgi:hypothetical protein
VEKALQAYEKLGIPWDDAFLSETVDDAGQRIWGSLWLFSRKHMLEARNVATSANYDVAVVTECIYARFELKNFDWENATHESRMFVRLQLPTTIAAKVQASGKNCERLARIVKEVVAPLLSRA